MKRKFLSIAMVALLLLSGINVYLANQQNKQLYEFTLDNLEAQAGIWDEIANWWYETTPIDIFYDQNGQEVSTGLPGTNWAEYQVYTSCTISFGSINETYYKYLSYCGYGQGSCYMSEHC
ncbi:MAG: hypothetical protein MJ211_07280 [Bacteroidales bacterium]|nr:hypothetical protein [Bacteroidales bacterium]